MRNYDVAVVGGGLIGAAIAFELASEKLRVLLLDRQTPGREASWAAAGMLSAAPDGLPAIPLIPLAQESLRLYPAFVKSVERVSKKSAQFERRGALHLFSGKNAGLDRDEIVARYRSLGLAIDPLSLGEARARESSLGPEVAAAAWNPDEARIDPRAFTEAVLAAAQKRGAKILPDSPISRLLFERGRCSGVLACGKKILAASVVLAAGSFSAAILGKNSARVPTRPVRGQMIALRPRGFRLAHVLRSGRGYLVPRQDGRVIAGSTLEDAGFDKCVTPAGLRSILAAATEMVPALDSAEILDTWSGLRPGTPDELPILGPSHAPGLFIATGHYRNGILLAPVTARLTREWILAGKTNFDAAPFSPLRFTT